MAAIKVLLPKSRVSELQRGRLGSIMVLPDYFVDRVVRTPSPRKLARLLARKAKAGGGSVHRIPQLEIKGGNAVNVAHALARQGARVHLLIVSDKIASMLLQAAFAPFGNVSVVTIDGQPGLTTALEFHFGGRHVNVMLSDLGDLARLDWETIEADVKRGLRGAAFAVAVNWAALRQHGNEIVRSLCIEARQRHARTFLDPADISGRSTDFRDLMKQTVQEGLVDVLSINENEARIVCRLLGVEPLPPTFHERELKAVCRSIGRECPATVDVHTPIGSATSDGEETEFAPAFPVRVHVETGAGDVWDAGDLVGYLLDLSPKGRLIFANACARLYLASRKAVAPTLPEVRSFLSSRGLLVDS